MTGNKTFDLSDLTDAEVLETIYSQLNTPIARRRNGDDFNYCVDRLGKIIELCKLSMQASISPSNDNDLKFAQVTGGSSRAEYRAYKNAMEFIADIESFGELKERRSDGTWETVNILEVRQDGILAKDMWRVDAERYISYEQLFMDNQNFRFLVKDVCAVKLDSK